MQEYETKIETVYPQNLGPIQSRSMKKMKNPGEISFLKNVPKKQTQVEADQQPKTWKVRLTTKDEEVTPAAQLK